MIRNFALVTLLCASSLCHAQKQVYETFDISLLASNTAAVTTLLLEVKGKGIPLPMKDFCQDGIRCWDIELQVDGTPTPVERHTTILNRGSSRQIYLWLTYRSPTATDTTTQSVQVSLKTLGLRYEDIYKTKINQPPLTVNGKQHDDIAETPWPVLLQRVDQKLNEHWKRLPASSREHLLGEQRAWLAYRDADCAFQAKAGISSLDRCLYLATEKRTFLLPPVESSQ